MVLPEATEGRMYVRSAVVAKAGFPAFHYGPRGHREVDFLKLRRMLADGHPYDDELIRAISPHTQEPVAWP